MEPISQIFPELGTPKKIVITMHQKPDGDAMGSSLGLYHFLVELGHSVQVISPTNWANFLDWMPGIEQVIDYEINKDPNQLHEANLLKLDCSKAHILLKWKDVWDSETTFEKTVKWYKAYYECDKKILLYTNFSISITNYIR